VRHYRIETKSGALAIKGSKVTFNTLFELVAFYSNPATFATDATR
jgi:hypothetical protein